MKLVATQRLKGTCILRGHVILPTMDQLTAYAQGNTDHKHSSSRCHLMFLHIGLHSSCFTNESIAAGVIGR